MNTKRPNIALIVFWLAFGVAAGSSVTMRHFDDKAAKEIKAAQRAQADNRARLCAQLPTMLSCKKGG
ncbi:hypothetical protein D3C81_1259270 [compost metagenome]